jgi:hypothetical protein
MATSTINATYQGRVGISVTSALLNWVTQVRNATTGTFVATYTSNVTVSNAVDATYDGPARGGYTGTCARVPLFFDVSSITATNTITAATLKVWNPGFGTFMDTIIVEGSAWGGDGSTTTLSTANYNDLDFFTAYSSDLSAWAATSYNNFSLNATAISDMNTNGYLNCFLINASNDYEGVAPPLEEYAPGARVEYLDATNKIKVELTYSPSGYGNNPIGVGADSVGEILGVARASVSKFLGV